MNLRNIKIINNYAKRVIEKDTKRLKKDDWAYVGKDIKTNRPEFNAIIAKRVIMSNLELANNKIMDLLLKNDIKPERALNLYKEAETMARNKENSGDIIKIADRYIELHDLKPQKVNITETRKTVDYDKLLPETKTQTISTSKSVENGEFPRVNTKDSEKTDDNKGADD